MKLRDYMVADQFHRLLDGLGHEAIGLVMAVERKLQTVGAPGITWRMESVDPGLLRALAGKRRDFLVIGHERFREYRVLIGGQAYGTALQVSWLLMATTSLVNEVKRAFQLTAERDTRFDIGAELDFLDMLTLRAWLDITKMAVNTALAELTDDEKAQIENADDAPEFG